MKKILLFMLVMVFVIHCTIALKNEKSSFQIVPFGEGGQHKMTYDRRQRPQAVLIGDEIHMFACPDDVAVLPLGGVEALRKIPGHPMAASAGPSSASSNV